MKYWKKNKWVIKTITKEELATRQSIAFSSSEQFDLSFVELLFSSKVVDKSIENKVSTLQEKHRLANLVTFAKDATSLQPIHLFGHYYYNGKVIFSCKSGGRIYLGIDLTSFKPTVYGASDQGHVLSRQILRNLNE